MGVKVRKVGKEWGLKIDHQGKRKAFSVGSKVATNALKPKVELELAKGKLGIIEKNAPALKEISQEWLCFIEERRAIGTYTRYKGIVNNKLSKKLLNMPIDTIERGINIAANVSDSVVLFDSGKNVVYLNNRMGSFNGATVGEINNLETITDQLSMVYHEYNIFYTNMLNAYRFLTPSHFQMTHIESDKVVCCHCIPVVEDMTLKYILVTAHYATD